MTIDRNRTGNVDLRDRRLLIGDDDVCAGVGNSTLQRPSEVVSQTAPRSNAAVDHLDPSRRRSREPHWQRRYLANEAAAVTQSP